MRRITVLLLAILCAGAVWGQENTDKKKVAVYVTGGSDVNFNKVVGSKLAQAIINNGKYTAVERTEAILNMLRKEQVYQRSGNVDDRQIGKLGQELGVDFVCVAEIVEVFGEKYISARLIDAVLAEAVAFADVNGDISNMTSLVKMSAEVAGKLLGNANSSNNAAAPKERGKTIYIESEESLFGTSVNVVANKVKADLAASGCSFTDLIGNADFVLKMKVTTRLSDTQEGLVFCYADAAVELFDNYKQKVIYSDEFAQKGGSNSQEKAGRKAMGDAAVKITEKLKKWIE